KVWPTLADRDAFLAAVGEEPGPAAVTEDDDLTLLDERDEADEDEGDENGYRDTPEPGGVAVSHAHAYFLDAVARWAAEAGPGATVARLTALTRALTEHLRAVVIHLDPGDNAQGIFETLNHRGAPLLAADLIKNLVFRVAQAQGLDVVPLYQRGWADLDGPYWRAHVRRGRQVVPRVDV